jgi:beta-glucanase (GH16 family)
VVQRFDRWRLLVVGALAAAAWLPSNVLAAKRPSKPPTALGSFEDSLVTYDTTRWVKADGWKNGSPFDNAWLADHASFHDGHLDLQPRRRREPGRAVFFG